MPSRILTTEEQATVNCADEMLRDWPRRLAMLPAVKPLSANWMPAVSPSSGQRGELDKEGTWWTWSPDEPSRLRDDTTGEWLPDKFPFRNHAAFRSFQHALVDQNIKAVAQAYQITRENRYARVVAELLVYFGALYPTYPTTIEEDAAGGELKIYGAEMQGTQYTVRVRHAWLDTEALQFWLGMYRLVRNCPDISEEDDTAIRELAREVIEFESLPNLLYINDKYHNSLTNYYEAFVLAASIWGDSFRARDTLSGSVYSGGDLAQLAINGPKGIRLFAANAFDRNGIYWELSPSYTGYIFTYLERTLQLLQGYRDPDGYWPGEAVKPFYESLNGFDAATALPELWRGVLSDTRLALNNGLYVPTNDTNYMGGPDPDWMERWAAILESPGLSRAARGVRRFREEQIDGEFDVFPPDGSTLMPASGAATLRGPANRFNLHIDWHRMQDYHSHKDPLNIVASVDGYLVLSDLGYHLDHPLRHIVSERTAVHNTVTVDGEDSAYHGRGRLHAYVGEGDVQLVEASLPDAYGQCELYRRCTILVGDRYLLDVFHVRGGESHDYALLSRADDSSASVPLARRPGTLADTNGEYAGWQDLDESFATPSPAYAAMHDVRALSGGGAVIQVDWPQRDRPDLTTRIHNLTKGEFEVVLAKVPHQDRRAEMKTRTDEILLVRRSGAPPLASRFVSVVEVHSGSVIPLSDVRQLELESLAPDAVAVEVSHEDGVDIVMHALSDGPHRLRSHPLLGDCELHGRFVALRIPKHGGEVEVTMLSGKLSGSFGELCCAPAVGARVENVDIAKGLVTLDRPVPEANSLSGVYVETRGRAGESEHWRVLKALNDRTLQIDLDHSSMVTMQGVIEAVENDRTFWSGLNLCNVPLYGTSIRIGEVGDFSAPRYFLEYAKQTGLPQRVGGTTTNHEPRRFAFGLDKLAKLNQDDGGKHFWVSGIEVGDYLVTQPTLRTRLNWNSHKRANEDR